MLILLSIYCLATLEASLICVKMFDNMIMMTWNILEYLS